jgi:2-polyprenyl-3-methyl-5-hydroxy-6-metoxy-1,4-benzoquinol methylase
VWSNPRPSADEIRRYYSSEYRLDYKGRSTPSLRHVARSGRGALNRYRALAPTLKRGDRILDAGSGGGEVVYVLRRLGFDASEIEPDAEYAQHARLTLGVPIETGFVQDLSYPARSFDVVTMYHALEHVEDPVAILKRLRSWIVDGGVLVVEVPNVEARSWPASIPIASSPLRMEEISSRPSRPAARRPRWLPIQATTPESPRL